MRNPILILLIFFSAFIQAQEKYQLSSHILDISQGKPAPNVKIALSKQDENQNWVLIDEKYTDNNGRIKDFLKEESNKNNNGVYKLTFYITPYFEKLKQKTFYPFIEVVFEIKDNQHYHIPITLSPYGYSTYRGN
ncbi:MULTISPECIES: hydroxyisourate hydrolase [Capnocytophaga]|jgi:hydroxyisourate hydrolase|uniref:5-hydroxyisourate hydrolase n=1 Tax=Capnocytophaga leadbetteri TaxID=327575 RepID=A0A250F899_9FLAO|nr:MULTISPECIES: hydroxyisourate hydrolase [Capnocytophaga]ATA81362.1 5-hydroxyisourate hydrolase [Capnocytophaga leadbetteri]KHE70803.1 hydroxyisourate hydrolase [Capnocytophaga sp. oral taxon 329 str. F0087]QGS18330.1 hydroxyisourate hydrolase [Capnocytophaga sp. FDAARGOS_737]